MAAATVSVSCARQLVGVCTWMLVLGLLRGEVEAQQASAEGSRGQLSAGFGAQTPDFDRSVFEVGYKRSKSIGTYTLAVNLRFGRYSALDLLGRERAQADGFTADAHPLYASMFYGLQGPAPLLRSVRGAYARASVGLTSYLGQSAGSSSDPQPVREIGPRFAPGMEFTFGIGQPSGSIRPWSEIRVGGEYMSRTGLGFVGPVLAVGIDMAGP